MSDSDTERARRWRLILGGEKADGTGVTLGGADTRMDAALQALYDSERKGGLGGSQPNIARWLGDIREYFPASVVQVMQRDAIERLDLRQMLLEPELLAQVEPDVQLVATLVALKDVLPTRTRETARQVVRQVVEQLLKRLRSPTQQALQGSLHRATRNRRPRHNEIDWNRTIRANLKHYQPTYRTVIPATRHGYGRQRGSLREVILLIDQSGSMATSAVYAGVFGAILASLPAIRAQIVAFDTSVVDLTAELHDPVELLFGINLGGGTDINRALGYCQGLIRNPRETIVVLISDLYEGGDRETMLRRAAQITGAGAQLIALLALSDEGAPSYDHALAQALAELGAPAFACTPDQFPDLMAAAIERRDLAQWVAGLSTQLTKL